MEFLHLVKVTGDLETVGSGVRNSVFTTVLRISAASHLVDAFVLEVNFTRNTLRRSSFHETNYLLNKLLYLQVIYFLAEERIYKRIEALLDPY